jgi:hypothetical protein
VQTQLLTGWKLQDASGKIFTVGDTLVAPQSCVVFGNTETKISLNNDKETISLFNADGNLVDLVSYSKTVKDNQALARASAGGELQITTTPTKGDMRNVITAPPPLRKASASAKASVDKTEDTAKNIQSTMVIQSEQTDIKNEKVLVSGTNLWEPILIGVCVAGALAVMFVKIVIVLRVADERGQNSNNRAKLTTGYNAGLYK